MIDVCDGVSVDEDLAMVPVALGNVSEVENANPLTETLYLGNKLGLSHTQAQNFAFIHQFDLPWGTQLSKHLVVQGLSVDVLHQETI